MKPQKVLLAGLALLVSALVYADGQGKDRAARQAELDALCETARQKVIAAERARLVDECVEKGQRPDRATCERFYADYGASVGGRPPLFYDLPECVQAHEYRTSYRSANR